MKTQSINLSASRAVSTKSGQALEVEDWVETGWRISVLPSASKIQFLRKRPTRPDPMITLLVPPDTRAILSNHSSHPIVSRNH